jgi:hypothetical protein
MAGLVATVKFFNPPKAQDMGVNVGWFSDQKYNDSTSIAQVARWNEFGTKAGIPQRPFMQRAMFENEDTWIEQLRTLVQIEIDKGKHADIEKALKKFGEIAKGDIQKTILAGGFRPNSKITIIGGWMRNKKNGKPFYVKGKGFGKLPLIDTGIMVSSIQSRTDKELM